MFTSWFREIRLRRIERRLKSLHVRQRLLRERIEEAQQRARAGDASAKERAARLEQSREALVREVSDLTHKEKELKALLA